MLAWAAIIIGSVAIAMNVIILWLDWKMRGRS